MSHDAPDEAAYRTRTTRDLRDLRADFVLDFIAGADAEFCRSRLKLIDRLLNDRQARVAGPGRRAREPREVVDHRILQRTRRRRWRKLRAFIMRRRGDPLKAIAARFAISPERARQLANAGERVTNFLHAQRRTKGEPDDPW